MVTETFTVEVDISGEGDYGGTYDDITDDVIKMSWQIGLAKPYDIIARDSTAEIYVKNASKKYSPAYSSSPIYGGLVRGKHVRIKSTYGATTTTWFVGFILSIEPMAGAYMDRQTRIVCEGWFSLAQRITCKIPIQLNKTADEVIQTILEETSIKPPVLLQSWVLGVSTLEETTKLGAISDYYSGYSGVLNLGVSGDWSSNTSVYGAVSEVTGREGGGRFIQTREGTLEFWDRYYFIRQRPSAETFTNSFVELNYKYGDMYNSITVPYNTKTIGTTPEVLSINNDVTKIEAGATANVTFRYIDSDTGLAISGSTVSKPVQTTDYTGNTAEDGSGTDVTGYVTAELFEEYGNSAVIQYTNSYSATVWIQAGAQIKGIKIVNIGGMEYTVQDVASIASIGVIPYVYPYQLENLETAQYLASYILNKRTNTTGIVESLSYYTNTSATLMQATHDICIGERITVAETQTAINSEYHVVGEKHDVLQGKGIHLVSFILEPADETNYWILDTSALEYETIIGP